MFIKFFTVICIVTWLEILLINKFKRDNIDRLDSQTGVIYRNYDTKIVNKEIFKIKNIVKKIKFYLSNNIKRN